jgi:hypothetical protein
MVAASATAILNDINLSTFLSRPFRSLEIPAIAPNAPAAGFTHAFLTASLGRTVSRPVAGLVLMGLEMKCWKQSK